MVTDTPQNPETTPETEPMHEAPSVESAPRYAPPLADPAPVPPTAAQVQYVAPPAAAQAPYAAPQPLATGAPKKERNVLGIVAFCASIVGFVFACVPGALIVGWLLLPVGFILGIVSLFMKGKGKGLGISALIISVVGTIVGFVVFFAVVATSLDEAFGGGETTVVEPPASDGDEQDSGAAGPDAVADAAPEAGTRANPFPIGTTISDEEWEVTVNGVSLDASQAVVDANMFNDPAPEGQVYIMANLTATYVGTDEDGTISMLQVEYVTPEGNTVDGLATMAVAPDSFDRFSTLYPGASISGNIALLVPAATAAEGVLAVTPSMLGDKVFYAVK